LPELKSPPHLNEGATNGKVFQMQNTFNQETLLHRQAEYAILENISEIRSLIEDIAHDVVINTLEVSGETEREPNLLELDKAGEIVYELLTKTISTLKLHQLDAQRTVLAMESTINVEPDDEPLVIFIHPDNENAA
jgi:hypothetical protein